MAQNNRLYWLKFRTLLFGHPLASHHSEHSKVGIFGGIPIFGSDLISSQGYAPDAILQILLVAGAMGYAYAMKVSIAIVLLLASITIVYRKAIQKYPQGGGSYTIAKTFLGENFGLLAGASLTVDYILTVSVSVSSAIENLTGVSPWLMVNSHKLIADCAIILFMGWINLRGLKESAKLFAFPVYLYILTLALLAGIGIFKLEMYGVPLAHVTATAETSIKTMSWFLFARAVAGGTTALTGIEAVSNGVTAFKADAQKRAVNTLMILAVIVGLGLLGLVYLSSALHIVPTDTNTALNQLGTFVFGGNSVMYYILMGSLAAILVIASNTPFAGLPILLSLMAKDGYVPRYFKSLGDRLVYSAGIWSLAIVSLILIVAFGGNTQAMLPLYAIGVLLSFSLTGIGLAKNVIKEKPKKWIQDAVVFLFGGIVSFVVFLVFITTKFTEGAWSILIIIPVLMLIFKSIKGAYVGEMTDLKITQEDLDKFHIEIKRVQKRRAHIDINEYRNKIIIPVYDINVMVLKAMKYAFTLTPQVTAVHVCTDNERKEKLLRHWSENHIEIPLEFVDSPYRAIVSDLITYLDKVEKEKHYDTITVVMPEYVPRKLRHNFLHNQTAHLIKLMLLYRKNFLITSVPYHPEMERTGK